MNEDKDILYNKLNNLKRSILSSKSASLSKFETINELSEEFEVEYLEVLDANNLKQIKTKTSEIIIISAIRFGGTRLIDNIVFRRTNV